MRIETAHGLDRARMLASMSECKTARSARLAQPGARVSRLTLANALTMSRLVAAPLLAAAILSRETLAAGLLFAFAVATDAIDGRVARRRSEASAWGGVFDHATDATFVVVGLAAVSRIDAVPLLLPALIALAFVQYLVDSRAHRGRRLRASALGRWNGIAYFVVLGIPLVRDALGLAWPGATLLRAIALAVALSTIASMLDRLLAPRAPE